MRINEINAEKVFDSRSEFTIEVSVNGEKASAPEGKSKGKYETHPYSKSLDWNINAIKNLEIDFEINKFEDLSKLESLIKKKFKLRDARLFGANALFVLESAVLKALAKSKKQELWQIINSKANHFPKIVSNVVGGGEHSHKDNHPIFQEFLLIPKSNSVKSGISQMRKEYKKIGRMLKSKKINDEGAWETDKEEESILQTLSKFKKKFNIGIDVAASTFYRNNSYFYNDKILTKPDQIEYLNELISKYNLFYLEDPLEQENFSGFSRINKKNLVVGDDLTATQISRLKKAIKCRSINAMIVKPNQNGSLLNIKNIFEICRKNKIKTIFSHRSGETLDSAIADYAFGFQADYFKCGAATKWRDSKLNRLIEIEKQSKKGKTR